MIYYPFIEYWPLYLGFIVFVLFMLGLDLGVFHKKVHEVSVKEASIWTVVWIGLALVFNVAFYYYTLQKFQNPELAKTLSLEFLTGFLIEKSLAIDNIFIFALVFSYFKIPKIYQHRVLFWGILGALFFRGVFIALGSVLMEYKAVVIFFGVFLIITGVKMLFKSSEEEDLETNFMIKLLKKFFKIHPKIENQKFFVNINGKRFVTPLFIGLIFIELTDIIFAIDSVPAIFSITKEPLIVFTSNIFAIMGLRSMYFMLISVIDRFYYIKYGLALVLVFVGLKMTVLNELYHGKFPTTWSLGIIVLLIGGSIVYSLFHSRKLK